MKRTAYLLTLLSTLLFQGCDKVEPPYYEGGVADVVYIGTDAAIISGDTLTFEPDNTPAIKKVLLEDYTGHTCGNCPAAAQYIVANLVPANADQLITMAVHAGDFAKTTDALPNQPAGSFQTDFTCSVGDAWYTKFNVNFNPCGMVNRAGYPAGSHLKPYLAWNSAINAQKSLAPSQKIRLKSHLDTLTGIAHVAVQTENLLSASGELKLQVVVTEDSVMDWQVWYGHTPEYEPTYYHRHVLRTTLNSSFGETVYNGNFTSGEKRIRGYSVQLNPDWDFKHCSIVAFLYDATTELIVQVEELHLED
jgi:hypothetical protein